MLKLDNIKRLPYNWNPVEEKLGYTINDNYKTFYETIGSIGIDDYIYIINPTNCDYIDGLFNFRESVNDAYVQLEEFLEDDLQIKFFDGTSGWLPIGYTTNGDFVFCDSLRVMITDEGFEEREIYNKSLIEFIQLYLEDNLEYKVLSDGLVGEQHKIEIIMKSSSLENKN